MIQRKGIIQYIVSGNKENVSTIMPVDYDQWVQHAACAKLENERQNQEPIVDDFYPPVRLVRVGESTETDDERTSRERRAKLVCGRCAVRQQCLGYALELERKISRTMVYGEE